MSAPSEMRIERIVLAVERMEAMVGFYDRVFGTSFDDDGTSPVRRGVLAGVPLVLCPNELAGVVAERNRHQLRLAVHDVDAVLSAVRANGGTIVNETDEPRRVVGIADPDGNTYEVVAHD